MVLAVCGNYVTWSALFAQLRLRRKLVPTASQTALAWMVTIHIQMEPAPIVHAPVLIALARFSDAH